MLVHRRATPHHLICRYPDVYPCVESSIMRVVSCPRTRTARPGDKRSNHEATEKIKETEQEKNNEQRKKKKRKETNEWMNEKLKDETILYT